MVTQHAMMQEPTGVSTGIAVFNTFGRYTGGAKRRCCSGFSCCSCWMARSSVVSATCCMRGEGIEATHTYYHRSKGT